MFERKGIGREEGRGLEHHRPKGREGGAYGDRVSDVAEDAVWGVAE